MFTYRNGVSHVGIVESFDTDCFWMSDYNYHGDGKYGRRCVPYDSYALRGFWSPPNQKGGYRDYALSGLNDTNNTYLYPDGPHNALANTTNTNPLALGGF